MVKKISYVFLLLFISFSMISCAETDNRPDWKVIYPDQIGDSQGLISFDVQTFSYSATTSDPNISVWVTSLDPAILFVGDGVETNSVAFTNSFVLTNGLNQIQVKLEKTGYKGLAYDLQLTYFNPAGDTRLQSITVSDGFLIPDFDSGTYVYKVYSLNSSIDVTATTYVPNPSFTINGSAATSGVPSTVSGLSADSNYIDIAVTSGNALESTNYGLIVLKPEIYPSGVTFTTANYSFSGGIQAVRDLITGTVFFTNVIEGIVTAKNGTREVWVQDDTAGVLIYDEHNDWLPANVNVGDRIQLTCHGGKVYNDLKEVSVIETNSLVIVSSGNSVYYQTGPIDSSSLGKYWVTPMYISESSIGYGNHDIDGWGQFRKVNTALPAGAYYFYGPVSRYRDTIQMMVY